MLSDKDIELLSLLYNKEAPMSIKELSEYFSVSERSIRYYVDNLNYELKEHGVSIVKKICTLPERAYVGQFLQEMQPQLYSGDTKKKLMLYRLCFEGSINLSAVSRNLDISRSSAKSYMDDIRATLTEYHLELLQEHKKGLVLTGSEENIRKLLLQLLMEYERLPGTQQKLLTEILSDWRSGLAEGQIHEFLHVIQKDLGFVLSDHSYSIMFYSCLIVLARTALKHTLLSCDNEYFLIACPEYKVIEARKELLKQQLNRYEIMQLTSLLIGSNYAQSSNLRENEWFEHDLLVSKIINLYSKYYQLNLNQDRTLYESLLTHLRPTMYRLLNHIPVSDMDYRLIQQQFPKEYEVMKQVLTELNFFTGEHQDQDETALLTLHFKAAINRCEKNNSKKKNILIICSHGYGTSRLLEQQLSDTYEVNVLDCIPYHYLKQYELLHQVDMIVTTINTLKACHDLPILHVHPILSSEDIQLLDEQLLVKRKNRVRMSTILEAVKKSCTIHDYAELKMNLGEALQDMLIRDDGRDQTLIDILPAENILLDYHAEDWRDAIRTAGGLLVENGYVDQRYQDQMLYSFENYGSYMIIDDGIAIPHAKNEGTVRKTGMTLLVLHRPVEFMNGKKLQVFFSFCSKDNIEHLDALVAVANLIKETDFRQCMKGFYDSLEVVQFIKSHTQESTYE